MSYTIRLSDFSLPQAWIIPNATPHNDGVMTKEQAQALKDVTSSRPLIPNSVVDLVDTVTKAIIRYLRETRVPALRDAGKLATRADVVEDIETALRFVEAYQGARRR